MLLKQPLLVLKIQLRPNPSLLLSKGRTTLAEKKSKKKAEKKSKKKSKKKGEKKGEQKNTFFTFATGEK